MPRGRGRACRNLKRRRHKPRRRTGADAIMPSQHQPSHHISQINNEARPNMESHGGSSGVGGGGSSTDCSSRPGWCCCCWPSSAAAPPRRRRRRRPAKEPPHQQQHQQQPAKTGRTKTRLRGDAGAADGHEHAAAAGINNTGNAGNTGSTNPLGRTFRRNIFFAGEGDVYDFYDPIETIGIGSISTISTVRKKNVGGSARYPPPGTGRGWGGAWPWLTGGGSHKKKKAGGGGGGGGGQEVVDLGSGVRLGANNGMADNDGGSNHRGGSTSGTGTTGFFTAAGSIFFEQLLGRSGAPHDRTTGRDGAAATRDAASGGGGDELGSSIRFGRLDSRASATSSSSVPGYARVRNDGSEGMVFALKAIDLRVVNDDYLRELRNEIEVLKTLDHPNIVRAYESFQKKKNIYLIMEYLTGGDLHARHPYTEREAAMIVGKVLSAVSYMHKHHVLHRDIKYENIMFESSRPDAEVKLIDFGLATEYLDPKHVMTERVGTVYSMAPDVLLGAYSYPADLWSLGVVAHMLISGTKPFWSNKKKRIVEKILRSRVKFDAPEWRLISKEAKEFVSLLLQKDPDKRPTAEEAQAHAWLRNEYKLSDRRPDEAVMNKVSDALVNYADSGEFKKVALNVIAHKSTAEQISEIRAAFDAFDSDNDGRITIKGFKAALSKFNYSEEELDRMFKSVDVNQDKDSIYFTEFLAACLESQGRIEEHRLAEAFDRLDADDSGYISRENLRSILGKNCTEAYLDRLMSEADVNGDGQIEYAEFVALFMDQKRFEIQEIYDADEGTYASNHDEDDMDAYDAIDLDRIRPGPQ